MDLAPSEVGRPISAFAQKFFDENLLRDAEAVLKKLTTIEAEVPSDYDRWCTSANWIARDGTPTLLPPGSLEISPARSARVENRDVPVVWRVRIPERGFDVTTSPLNDQA